VPKLHHTELQVAKGHLGNASQFFVAGCMVGQKAEKNFGPTFFWILTGLAPIDSDETNQFFIIPSKTMATNVTRHAKKFHATPTLEGRLPKETQIRIVPIPPSKNKLGWSIEKFRNGWDLIDEALN
jgi:hypothetical protein